VRSNHSSLIFELCFRSVISAASASRGREHFAVERHNPVKWSRGLEREEGIVPHLFRCFECKRLLTTVADESSPEVSVGDHCNVLHESRSVSSDAPV
jgi:hypothetical protein